VLAHECTYTCLLKILTHDRPFDLFFLPQGRHRCEIDVNREILIPEILIYLTYLPDIKQRYFCRRLNDDLRWNFYLIILFPDISSEDIIERIDNFKKHILCSFNMTIKYLIQKDTILIQYQPSFVDLRLHRRKVLF